MLPEEFAHDPASGAFSPRGAGAGVAQSQNIAAIYGFEEAQGEAAFLMTSLWALSPDGQFALGRIGPTALWARVAEMADLKAWTPLSDLDEFQADTSYSPDSRFVVYDAGGIYIQP